VPDTIPTSFKAGDLPDVTTGPLPASRKVHVPGALHPSLRVAMREIAVSGEAPVRVYDTSGPYTDSDARVDIRRGLPELRRYWIEARGDVERHAGRETRPEDDGLKPGEARKVPVFDRAGRLPLRGKPERP
jgi:phosphomethylpyrimidine synthase